MRFVAIFEDDIDPASIDSDLTREHFAYLAANTSGIVLAGGLRDDVGKPFNGTLWVIEAADKSSAVRLVEDDPYTRAGLRPLYRVLAWGKAPHFGTVVL